MPRTARWLIKTALVYLVIGLALGVVRAGQGLGIFPGTGAQLWLPQLHLLTVGWLTQLIFGVAFWLFPAAPDDEAAIGESTVWAAYVTLNLGLVLRVVAEPGFTAGGVGGWVLVFSAILQWLGSILFVLYFWRRVREK